MVFSINNYSVLNSYNYAGKSAFLSALDFGSTPCRRMLGGRSVNVQSLTYTNPISTVNKVKAVFGLTLAAFLIVPIAVISSTCLALKMVTLLCSKEKEKVMWNIQVAQTTMQQNQKLAQDTQDTQNKKNEFHNAVQNNDPNLAIRLYAQYELILSKESDVVHSLEQIISPKREAIFRRIFDGAMFQELQGLILELPVGEAVPVIGTAISIRLQREYIQTDLLTSGRDILAFIRGSLQIVDAKSIEYCVSYWLRNGSKIDSGKDLLQNLLRLDIADYLIIEVSQIVAQSDPRPCKKIISDNTSAALRALLVQSGNSFHRIFNDAATMEVYSKIFGNIRAANTLRIKFEQDKTVLDTQNWNTILREFENSLQAVDLSALSADEQRVMNEILAKFMLIKENITNVMTGNSNQTQIQEIANEISAHLTQVEQPDRLNKQERMVFMQNAQVKKAFRAMLDFLLKKSQEANEAMNIA